jgi:mono/diheme cytochrome c family protein
MTPPPIRLRTIVMIGTLVLAIWGGILLMFTGTARDPVSVVVPDLSAAAQAGRQAFELKCARCHGVNAAGGPVGPPLVDRTYASGHHADIAFVLAVRRGVRAHHWRFGDMPAQPEVSDAELTNIVRYIRKLQRANGI